MTKNKKTILWLTRSAVFLAFLLVLQVSTRPMGQYVTGSAVNLVLILAVMLAGLYVGLTVAALSPIFAFLVGVGPALPPVLPFLMLANVAFVLVWHFVAGKANAQNLFKRGSAAIVFAAVLKFALLYFGVVRWAVPFVLNLPQKQAAVISAGFSLPQLITAAIGGMVAMLVLPALKKATKN